MYINLLMIKLIYKFLILTALTLGSVVSVAKAEGKASSCTIALTSINALSPNLSSKQRNNEIGKILESTKIFKEASVYKETLPSYGLQKYTRILTHVLNAGVFKWKVNRKNKRGKQGINDTRGVYLSPYVKAASIVENYIMALDADKPSFINKYTELLKPTAVNEGTDLSGFSLFEDSMVVLGKEAKLRKNWIEKIAIYEFNSINLQTAIDNIAAGQSEVTLTQVSFLEDGTDLLKTTHKKTFKEVKKRSSVKKALKKEESGKSQKAKLVMSLKQVLKKEASTQLTYAEEIKGTGFQVDRGDFEGLNASVYESLEQLDILVETIEGLSFEDHSALSLLEKEAAINPESMASDIVSLYRGYKEKSKNEEFGLSTYKELEQAESWYYASSIKAERANPWFGLVAHAEKAVGLYGEGRHTISTSESIKKAEKKFLSLPTIALKYPTFLKKVKGVSILFLGVSTLGGASWFGLSGSNVDVAPASSPAAIVQVVGSVPTDSPQEFVADPNFNSNFKSLVNGIDANSLTDYQQQQWQDWFAQVVDLKEIQAVEYLKSEGISVDQDYESPKVKELEATIEAIFMVHTLNPELITPAN